MADEEAEFLAGVRRGIEQADLGDVLDHQQIKAAPVFIREGMDIRWAKVAAANLTKISNHIRSSSPETAVETIQTFFISIEHLVAFPNRGLPGREPGTREIPLPPVPYIAAYRASPSLIEILYISDLAGG